MISIFQINKQIFNKRNPRFFYLHLTCIIFKKSTRKEFMSFILVLLPLAREDKLTTAGPVFPNTSMSGFLETSFGAEGMSGESCMFACLNQQEQKRHVTEVYLETLYFYHLSTKARH
ncbi:hypothetical protein ILYODFUR_014627 [Ilyodon furcidens]|uniref:Uncharacterized protein n=1 Tax=Ilyodon furcidens TaxID=33524 RepID=A0ABV0T813_9TELE